MDKFFKRVLIALLGVFLALGVAGTPAQAAEPAVDVKISNIIYTAEKGGDIATAYQLVRYADSGNDYEFADSAFKTYVESQELAGQTAIAYLSSLSNSGVASLMTSYLRNVGTPETAYGNPATAVDGNTATLQGLEPGYYLILVTSKNGSSYSPMLVFVRYDGSATAKAYGTADGTIGGQTSELTSDGIQAKRADAITMEKKVLRNNGTGWHDTKTVQAGDEVTFRIAVTYPAYEENVDPHASLYDTLTNLKVASADDIALYSDESLTTKIEAGLKDVTVGDYGSNDTQSISAMINWDNVPEATGANGTVYIGYKATVMQRAATSGDASNSAYIRYLTSAALDDSSYTQTATDTTTLYSFAFDLKKVKEDGSALTGAQFKVYVKGSDDSGTATPVYFTQLSDGYVVTQAADGAIDTVEAKFGASGNELKIYGLDPFQYYYFEEITTPTGYVSPSGQFKLDLSSKMDTAAGAPNASGEHTGVLNAAWKTTDDGYSLETLKSDQDVTHSKFYAVNSNDDALVNVDSESASGKTLTVVLKNATTAALPTTGGMGTVLFTVVGVVLMAVAAGVFFFVRRRS